MSGGGGHVILGGGDLAKFLEDNFGKIAEFRQPRMREILEAYYVNENSIDNAGNLFALRCVADIIENR